MRTHVKEITPGKAKWLARRDAAIISAKGRSSYVAWDAPSLGTRINDLDTLAAPLKRRLANENIVFVGDLIEMSEAELMCLPQFGPKSVDSIKEALALIDLYLGMEITDMADVLALKR